MSKKFLFEHKREPVLPYGQFLSRMLQCFALAVTFLSATMVLGAIGFHYFENQPWIDGLFNAVMTMCGLGLQGEIATSNGKIFTIFYAFFSAFVFYSSLAILFTPPFHRFLHHFHLNQDSE